MSEAPSQKDRIEYTDDAGVTMRGERWLVEQMKQAANEMRAKELRWIADLRAIGIKAAHPDDGHVNRTRSANHDFVSFCYPRFDDGVREGDLIALGWPDEYRVRIVQRVSREGLFFKRAVYQVAK